jgi:hypothetical protein
MQSPAGYCILTVRYNKYFRVEMITKQVTVTAEDYVKFCSVAYNRVTKKVHNKWSFLKNFLIWCITTIVMMIIFQLMDFSLTPFHKPTAFLVATPLVLLIALLQSIFKNIQKSARPGEDSILIGQRTVEFSDEGFVQKDELNVSFIKWSALKELYEDGGDLYLFIDKALAFIIPASTFENDAERATLIEQINQLKADFQG